KRANLLARIVVGSIRAPVSGPIVARVDNRAASAGSALEGRLLVQTNDLPGGSAGAHGSAATEPVTRVRRDHRGVLARHLVRARIALVHVRQSVRAQCHWRG